MTPSALLHQRAVALLGGGLCLLSLGLAAELTRPYPHLKEVLANPQKYHDKPLRLIVECSIAAVTPEGFVLRQMDAEIAAQTPEKNLQAGDYVVVEGVLRAPAILEVTRLRVAHKRRLKMAISLAPVLVVVFLVWRNVRCDRKAGMLFLKSSAHA
jgi:hypothetical protein